MAEAFLSTGDNTILIFGASGDLTARKLIPALFKLSQKGFLNERSPVIGVARRDKTDEQFRNELRESALKGNDDKDTAAAWDTFAKQLFYRKVDISTEADYASLHESAKALEQQLGTKADSPRVVYLATAPALFDDAVRGLNSAGMIPELRKHRDRLRVVVEKPFGHDLKSAEVLNEQLRNFLHEEQIYRIDHYLGKETVQNILLFRFGNTFFEPLLNRNHVDNVQITVAESIGMEGGRGAYYDTSGALRDVLQNHVLQLLCLVAMDPPALFQAREIRDEKMKVLQALRPGSDGSLKSWAIRGQYSDGLVDKQPALAYREEERVPSGSNRETYVGMHVEIDNWRWAGVPFYLRTGKRLPQRVTEIAFQFKHPPLNLFSTVECDGNLCDIVEARPNELVLRIQPQESIFLRFSTKRPGMQYHVQPVAMEFDYEDHFSEQLPEAYERLLLDVIRGDSTLFTRSDELLAAWKFVEPVLQHWETTGSGLEFYPSGTWGPAAADRLLSNTGRSWRQPKV
ncbi:glucose-6-phosphate dehydrogenase [Fuerstiella marisgermanici]|uniref:Glucose-6-phosphate 1-dehydrogenase n=1 Tax=Fuerstiella marisgermanici TaxID=1891926 RepID=A0A1P8WJA5_9PLAN|nr:glucose-6-phosphate dehydrogenase [Fuerstiella marisgermanici]APZ94140.1 Glucose-6-phosphate 1-dehydrogenase [Fuerstiella marisgermanici]